LGAIDPVSRRRWSSRRIQAGLTANRSAISARVSKPSSHAATTRCRKSIEYAAMLPPS
jgi:hypothetical protein